MFRVCSSGIRRQLTVLCLKLSVINAVSKMLCNFSKKSLILFTLYCICSFLHATDKRIILAYIFTPVVFASHAGATRFKNNTQQWPLSATNKSDGKVRYETTISTSIKVPDADQEMSFLLSEYETEGQGTETKSRQDNGNQFYLEVFIDKSRKHNNASGTQTSETHKMLPVNTLGSSTATEERKVAKIYHGQVGLRTDLSIDETEEQAYRKQEKMRSTIVEKLIEEMFPDVAPDFSELLNVKDDAEDRKSKKRKKKKYLKKLLMPLLIAYKLKFIAVVPVLLSAVVLLAGSTAMAGFFFALFAAAITNKD